MSRKRARRLDEVPPPPTCEATVGAEAYRYNVHQGAPHPERCSNAARYEVDGVALCGKHASGAALRILLNPRERIER